RRPLQIRSEVDDEQAVIGVTGPERSRGVVGEESQREGGIGQHGAVDTSLLLPGKGARRTAQREEVMMQRVGGGVRVTLAEIEHASSERRRIARVVDRMIAFERGNAGKLLQKL